MVLAFCFGALYKKRGCGVTRKVSFCSDGAVTWLGWGWGLMLGAAFLQPLHIWPFNTLFESFGLGIGCVFLAGLLLVLRGRYWLSPLLGWWCAFGGVLLVSALTVPQTFDASLYAYVGFWLVGLALTQLGGEFSWWDNSQRFAVRLAWFLVIVAGLSAVFACLRFYELWGVVGRLIPAGSSGRMSGLIGQSNVFALLSTLGLLSLLWLVAAKRVSLWLGLPLGLLLGYCMALSGSRVIYLIYAAVFALGVAQSVRQKSWVFSGVLLGFALCFVVFQPLFLQFDQLLQERLVSMGIMHGRPSVADVFERGMGSSRWVEWPLAWQIFIDHLPWGVGPGGYAAQSYAMHIREQALPLEAIWLHSHNSYLQLWVEFGWLGVCWMLGMGWLVAKVLWRAVRLEQPVQAIVLLAVLIHSFFEFPLWFMYFFVLAFGVLAAGQESRCVQGKPFLGGLATGIAVLAFAFYGWLFSGLIVWHSTLLSGGRVADGGLKFIDRLVQDPLLKPYALQFYYFHFSPGSLPVAMELRELEALRSYRPFGFFSVRYSILLAAVGRREEALKVRDEIIAVAPAYVPVYIESVSQVMRQHPAWELGFLLRGVGGFDEAADG